MRSDTALQSGGASRALLFLPHALPLYCFPSTPHPAAGSASLISTCHPDPSPSLSFCTNPGCQQLPRPQQRAQGVLSPPEQEKPLAESSKCPWLHAKLQNTKPGCTPPLSPPCRVTTFPPLHPHPPLLLQCHLHHLHSLPLHCCNHPHPHCIPTRKERYHRSHTGHLVLSSHWSLYPGDQCSVPPEV